MPQDLVSAVSVVGHNERNMKDAKKSELRSRVKVEVAVKGFKSVKVLMVSYG